MIPYPPLFWTATDMNELITSDSYKFTWSFHHSRSTCTLLPWISTSLSFLYHLPLTAITLLDEGQSSSLEWCHLTNLHFDRSPHSHSKSDLSLSHHQTASYLRSKHFRCCFRTASEHLQFCRMAKLIVQLFYLLESFHVSVVFLPFIYVTLGGGYCIGWSCERNHVSFTTNLVEMEFILPEISLRSDNLHGSHGQFMCAFRNFTASSPSEPYEVQLEDEAWEKDHLWWDFHVSSPISPQCFSVLFLAPTRFEFASHSVRVHFDHRFGPAGYDFEAGDFPFVEYVGEFNFLLQRCTDCDWIETGRNYGVLSEYDAAVSVLQIEKLAISSFIIRIFYRNNDRAWSR